MVESAGVMTVSLSRVGVVHLEASSPAGAVSHIEGSPGLRARVAERMVGGVPGPEALPAPRPATGAFRPMELLLVSLAACSALDVILVLTRQRQPLGRLAIEVEGTRKDAVPAVFERVHLRFSADSAVDSHKLERAVALSVDKYCSVRAMLGPAVVIDHSTWRS